MANSLNLARDQLATFLKTHEQIRQFELLLKIVSEVSQDPDTQGIGIQASNAQTLAVDTLAQLIQLAGDAASNIGAADQKSTQALERLSSIQQALSLFETSPTLKNDNSGSFDYIDLNVAAHVNRIRRLAWNSTDQTMEVGLEHDVVQQVGLELYARVGNTTGSTIPNGSVVGFAGATTDALLVEPYLADGATPSLYVLGVMTHDLPDSGEKGYATTWGFIHDIDTSSFSVGDILYASPTVTGGLTNVKPTAPQNVIPVAVCTLSHATIGQIFVRPTIEQQKYYGIFTKTADQSPAATNTEYLLTFDTVQISNGVVIGTPASRISVQESGLYNFDATVQLSSGSASTKNVWLWFKKNGTSVGNSSRIVTLNANNALHPIAVSQFFLLAAGDYIEIAFAADDVNVTVDAIPSTAFSPASPAVVLNVTQVQQ